MKIMEEKRRDDNKLLIKVENHRFEEREWPTVCTEGERLVGWL